MSDADLVGTPKPPCIFPLEDGRRCCECTACHPTPDEQRHWLGTPDGQKALALSLLERGESPEGS